MKIYQRTILVYYINNRKEVSNCMSGLDCNNCGGKLHLTYENHFTKLKNGEKIAFVDVPLLMCSECQKKYIPYLTKEILDTFKQELDAENESLDNNISESHSEETCSAEVKDWFDFKNLKSLCCNDKFIAEKVKFIYDKDDYYFIPGLIRPWKTGFLTPVFFNIEVLLKYIHHPQYGLDIGADTFGYIYKNDEHYISFGINENNKVIMWLGDIINLNVEEQFYLRSENIPSDHSISSEFYEAQIEVKWAEASSEKKLLKKRLQFNEQVRNNYNLAVAQLDTETLRIAKNIRKLLIDTNDAFKDLIIPLNELFVESINTNDIKNDLKKNHPEMKDEIKGKKGIKLFQLWLDKNTSGIDVSTTIAPLYVLYDLRLVSAHLHSDDSRESSLNNCCKRLGLAETERNYITIANTLIDKLGDMYDKFLQNLTPRTSKGDQEDEQ